MSELDWVEKDRLRLAQDCADLSIKLGRAEYLLKRIAGWVKHDPIENPYQEAREFLIAHGFEPSSEEKQREIFKDEFTRRNRTGTSFSQSGDDDSAL